MTSEMRDELVRAIMPELRVLTEQLVKNAVDRSIVSLLDRQRELETKVERFGGASPDKPLDLDAKLEAAIAPVLAKQSALEARLDASRHAEVRLEARVESSPLATRSAAQGPTAADQLAMQRQTEMLMAAALSRTALVDIPSELNGSRRKRLVVFLLVVTVVGILASVAALSVMSNMGAYP